MANPSHGGSRLRQPAGERREPEGARKHPKKAVILTAGRGRRLYPLTHDRPKALLEVNGETLLERLVAQTSRHGFHPVVVVGWQAARVQAVLQRMRAPTRYVIVENKDFDRTDTLFSLSLARPFCDGAEVLVIDGDLICDDRIIDALVADPRDAVLAFDSQRVMGDEEVKIRRTRSGRLTQIGKELERRGADGEFLGLAKYRPSVAAELFRACDELVKNGSKHSWYEDAIRSLIEPCRLSTLDVSRFRWEEIDLVVDYQEALGRFGDDIGLRKLARTSRISRQSLFCPGPVLVSGRVQRALACPQIGHREVEFSAVLNRVRLKLNTIFGVRYSARYTTVVITGSGSAANEALLGTAGIGRHLLMLHNGEFGRRLVDLARSLGLRHRALEQRWGYPFDLDAIDRAMATGRYDVVVAVHHETSTGMLNPIGSLAELARRHNVQTFVDAVSSVGGIPIEIEKHGITFCTGSANKAIESVPGLAFVCGRREEFEALKGVHAGRRYLNLYSHYEANEERNQTPNTPAVNLFFALDAALDEVLAEGLERRYRRFENVARRLRRRFAQLGLEPYIEAEFREFMSPLLTTLKVPTGFTVDEFHAELKRAGYIVYRGKDHLEERVFQVANMGALTPELCDAFLAALERVIKGAGKETDGRRRR